MATPHIMAKKGVVRSNSLHRKCAKTNALRANAAKTGTKNNKSKRNNLL